MNFYVFLNIYLLIILVRSVYPIALGFFYKHDNKKGNKIDQYNPLVSVIIPAWNEEVGVRKTILSVVNNSYSNIEIIVVNDGSSDKTSEIVQELCKEYSTVRLIDQPNGGKSDALNNGIKSSKGEIIVTIDADSFIEKDAIKYLVDALADPTYAAAVGHIKVGNNKKLVGIIQFLEYNFGYQVKRGQSVFDSIFILPGALCAIRRNVIEEVGYYENYTKTEDLEVSLKIRAFGHSIVHVDKAVCITEGASSFKMLLKQRFRWRHGGILCFFRHKKLFFNLKQHKYLSFWELPTALLGLFDILIYPLTFVFIVYSSIFSHEYLLSLEFYLITPFSLFLILDKYVAKHPKIIPYILLSPFLFNLLSFVEFIALIQSLHRIIFVRKNIGWTKWSRVGI